MFSMRLQIAPPAVRPALLEMLGLSFCLSVVVVGGMLQPSSEPPRLDTPLRLDFYFSRIADRAKLFEPDCMLVWDALIIVY